MTHNVHHEHLMKELGQMLKPLFDHSPQGIYLYLDDEHKMCNKKFAAMLGYPSISEWEAYQYPIEDVAPQDQKKAIQAYMDASQKYKASTLSGTWIRKNGTKIHTDVTLAPFTYQEEVFVLHFITEKK